MVQDQACREASRTCEPENLIIKKIEELERSMVACNNQVALLASAVLERERDAASRGKENALPPRPTSSARIKAEAPRQDCRSADHDHWPVVSDPLGGSGKKAVQPLTLPSSILSGGVSCEHLRCSTIAESTDDSNALESPRKAAEAATFGTVALASDPIGSSAKLSQVHSPPARLGQIRWSPSSPSSLSDGSPVRSTVDESQTRRLLAEARQAVADTSIRDYARKQCNVSGVVETESPKRMRRILVESIISTPSTIWANIEDRFPEPSEVGEKESLNLSIHGELLSDNALNKLQHRLKQHADLHVVSAPEAVQN